MIRILSTSRDGGQKSDKVDFSTLIYKNVIAEDTKTVPANEPILTLDVPAGTYKVTFCIRASISTQNILNFYEFDGTTIAFNHFPEGGVARPYESVVLVKEYDTSHTISMSNTTQEFNYSGNVTMIIAERIG